MQEMLEQARHMQDQMQEKLSQTVVEASSGGGAVTVKMNGQKQVLQLKIDGSCRHEPELQPGRRGNARRSDHRCVQRSGPGVPMRR